MEYERNRLTFSPLGKMGHVARKTQAHSRPKDESRLFDLPTLHNQQSLRDLVADDLQSRDDISMEMAALLLRRGTAETAAPSPETRGEGTGTLLSRSDDDEKNRGPQANEGQSSTRLIKERFQRWIFKRYCYLF